MLARATAIAKKSARDKTTELFHGLFYGRQKFGCKSTQFCATLRESTPLNHLASATLCKAVKHCGTRYA